ncbi:hypothetical protein D1007_45278 [Hordeum vulgare]|nr:hypothetical protein D1007_45278 [Hordeum vulgare]
MFCEEPQIFSRNLYLHGLGGRPELNPYPAQDLAGGTFPRALSPLPAPSATIAPPPQASVPSPRSFLTAMEEPMLSPVTVEVAHAPSPRADLVAGHVVPAAVAQAHVATSRKRQGNLVVQGGNPAAPAMTACAPGANAAVRSRPAAEKAGKAAGVKRRKVLAIRKPPYSTSDSPPPRKEVLRRCR